MQVSHSLNNSGCQLPTKILFTPQKYLSQRQDALKNSQLGSPRRVVKRTLDLEAGPKLCQTKTTSCAGET